MIFILRQYQNCSIKDLKTPSRTGKGLIVTTENSIPAMLNKRPVIRKNQVKCNLSAKANLPNLLASKSALS